MTTHQMTEPAPTYCAGPERSEWYCSDPGCHAALGYYRREAWKGYMLMVCHVTCLSQPVTFYGDGAMVCPVCGEANEWEWRKGYPITRDFTP